ncbi:protein kinase-like protein, partial [Leptotrombidium deliense]
PTFGASGSKPTSQSEDLAARYKRLEDSGLLRQLRHITVDEVEEDDESDKKAENLKCSEANSKYLGCEYQRVQKTLNKDFVFNVNMYKDALKNTKSANSENEKENCVASKELQNKTVDKVVNSAPLPIERSIVRQSKSEPELVNVNKNDEVDSVKHKAAVESNPVQINASLVKSSSTSKLSNSNENELKSFRINDKVYYKLNKLGQGGSSCVYQVYDPSTQKTLALKAVDLSKVDETTKKGFMNEIKLLLKLRHCERVVKLYDYCKVNSYQLIMIMEKGDSDLGSILRQFVETKNKYCLDPLIIKHYWKEMLKAVDEIHKLDVVHSDLKPVNFISVGGKLKLIDFGIANAIDNDQTSVIKDTQIGTVNYMAPESLSSKSDIRRKS